MNWFTNFVFKLLKIEPARERSIQIKEPLTFRANVLKNLIWYRGDPAELEQFFKASATCDIERSRFWASVPHGKVRKIHSGIVGAVIDRYKDIVTADLGAIEFSGESDAVHPILDMWTKIADSCDFSALIGEGISGVLSSGDGAFKISIEADSPYPIVSFYPADKVEYKYKGRRIIEILFYTEYTDGRKEYQLEEAYGVGYVKYRLLDDAGREVPLSTLEETKVFSDASFNGDFIMAVPMMFFTSRKWQGRGSALFDTKTDNLDGLDEIISQWLDAVRMGRVKRYIPDDMVPRNPDTGQLLEANPFDNDYIAVGTMSREGAQNKIEISQPQISYEAYLHSYVSFMDLVLQGIISPATLGIDLKKTDNAEAQREKEKVTLYVRGKIIDTLTSVVPVLVERIMQVNDLITKARASEYEVTVKFGEYASPDFGSTVEAVVKAKTGGVMSIEQAIEELYGDTWTQEEKAEEVERLKAEQGIMDTIEPAVNTEFGETVEKGANIETLNGGGTLNGAQIASLMSVIKMVKENFVTRSEGLSIIVNTLGIPRENAESFIEDNI